MLHRITATLGATALLAMSAYAGGLDRSRQPLGVLFETGNYIELSFTSVNPTVSGTQLANPALPALTVGSASGDMANSYGYAGVSLKFAVNEKVDVAILYDEPFGGNARYPVGGLYFAQGSTATVSSNAITTVGRYKFSENFSAYAGLRAQTLDAEVSIPFVPGGGYSAQSDTAAGYGFLAGVAYERPEIALRVALTYFSAVTHDLTAVETSAFGVNTTALQVETPQAVNLDFQTGINEKTLVFGGVRWAEWGSFDISPQDYVALVGTPILSYPGDNFTYTLGVARRLTDKLAVAVSASHEPGVDGLRTNLGPTDGFTSLGVGVNYRHDNMKIEAGIQHLWLGNATTAVAGLPAGEFTDNTALGFGMKVGFSF